MLGRTSILLLLLTCAVSQYVETGGCTNNGCTVSCSDTYDLSDIVSTTGSSTQIQYTTYFSTFTVYFLLPFCGSNPSSTWSWTTGDIWQYDNAGTYYLGLYNGIWTSGTYNGANAISTQYTFGQYCSGIGYRTTTLYLVCDASYSSSNPYISMSETSACLYSLVVGYSDICAEETGAVVTNDDDSGSSSSSSNTIVIIVVIVVFAVLAFISAALRYACYKGLLCCGRTAYSGVSPSAPTPVTVQMSSAAGAAAPPVMYPGVSPGPSVKMAYYAAPQSQAGYYPTPQTQGAYYAAPQNQAMYYATPQPQGMYYATPQTQGI